MKIAYVVPMLHEKGGIQEFARQQKKALSSIHRIDLYDWYSPTRLRDELVYRRLPKKLARILLEKRHYGDFNSKLTLQQLRKYDLVHYWIVDAAMAYPELPGVITCHGIEVLNTYVLYHRINKFLQAINNAKGVHTNSNFTKAYLIKNYNIKPSKLTVINPGIDLNKFTYKEESLGDNICIGTLTRFVKRKNIPNIIKSLKILKEHYGLDFTYYLAGDGSQKKYILKNLKRAGIKYKYFGKISDKDKLKSFYPYLDVFVLPPLKLKKDIEGFGIVFLEANSFGVPVVTSLTGGIEDALKPGLSGEFADPAQPEDIASKIIAVLNGGTKYRYSARKWAEKFDQKYFARKWQDYYEKVAKV